MNVTVDRLIGCKAARGDLIPSHALKEQSKRSAIHSVATQFSEIRR